MVEKIKLEFELPSSYVPEVFQMQKSLFTKEKSKNLQIVQSEKELRLHGHLLEDDIEFESFLEIFNSDKLTLPAEFSFEYVETLINYVYFKEIKPIAFENVFQLLKVAKYFKIGTVVHIINKFLQKNLNEIEKASLIYRYTAGNLFRFKEYEAENMKIFGKCVFFLLENDYFEDFLKIYDSKFFEEMAISEKIEEIFRFLLYIMKQCKITNDKTIRFLQIFQEPLKMKLEEKQVDFNNETYFTKVLEESLDFLKIEIKEMNDIISTMKIPKCNETKDLLINFLGENIRDNKKEIVDLRREIIDLRKEVKDLKQNEEGIKKEINDFKQKNSLVMDIMMMDYFFEFEEIKNLTFSNFNKTVRRNIHDSWDGVRCATLIKILPEKLLFSIRIDKYSVHLKLGISLNSEKSNGNFFHNNKNSFMIGFNGKFYNRSIESEYVGLNINNNDIITEIFDIKQKTLEFFVNGKSLGHPKKLDFDDKEMSSLCPCIDLGSQNLQVTIMEYEKTRRLINI